MMILKKKKNNSDLEEDFKAFISNISSDTSSYENPKYDIYVASDNNDIVRCGKWLQWYCQTLFNKWQDDLKVLDVQKGLIKSLMADNHRLMSTIVDLKCELSQMRAKDLVCKSVRMLNSGIEALEEIITKGKTTGDNSDLGFSKSKNM